MNGQTHLIERLDALVDPVVQDLQLSNVNFCGFHLDSSQYVDQSSFAFPREHLTTARAEMTTSNIGADAFKSGQTQGKKPGIEPSRKNANEISSD
jgi:hypothetical protein